MWITELNIKIGRQGKAAVIRYWACWYGICPKEKEVCITSTKPASAGFIIA